MSVDKNGIIAWLRSWFDDIYALKGEGGEISLNDVYPVGSIYISVNNANPSTLFGGTWEQIKDKFLLSSGTTYANGTTGGSADTVVIKHNHTQNAHTHPAAANSFVTTDKNLVINGTKRLPDAASNGFYWVRADGTGSIGQHANTGSRTATNNETGVDGTGKNMPPYLVVYMWKRTA